MGTRRETLFQEEGRDGSGSGYRPSGAMVKSCFPKNRLRCFLSPLVVMPPCHLWLSPLVVTLTGSGKRRKILSGPALPGPGKMSGTVFQLACGLTSPPTNSSSSIAVHGPSGREPSPEIVLCYVQHEINMHGVKRKNNLALIGLFQDSCLEKALYIAVNRFYVSAGPARRFADGHRSGTRHDLQ